MLVVLGLTGNQAPAGACDTGSQHLVMWLWLLHSQESHQEITWTAASRTNGSHAGDLPANSGEASPKCQHEGHRGSAITRTRSPRRHTGVLDW